MIVDGLGMRDGVRFEALSFGVMLAVFGQRATKRKPKPNDGRFPKSATITPMKSWCVGELSRRPRISAAGPRVTRPGGKSTLQNRSGSNPIGQSDPWVAALAARS